MSWDATGGAVVEDDRGRRYEGVWVSASARDVNSAPLPALAPVGRPPAGMAWDGKCGPRDIKILNPGVFNPLPIFRLRLLLPSHMRISGGKGDKFVDINPQAWNPLEQNQRLDAYYHFCEKSMVFVNI